MGVSYNSVINTNGLVLCLDAGNKKSYPGNGTAWNDLSRYGNDGTLINGPTYNTSGGGSIDFNGLDRRISISNPANNAYQYTFSSVSAWINVPSIGSGNKTIYGESIAGGPVLSLNVASGKLAFAKNVSGWKIVSDPSDIPISQWVHVCGVSSPQNMFLYVNGIQKASGVGVAGGTTSIVGKAIGNSVGATERFLGSIAEVLIYNQALNPNEIRQIFNSTRRRFGV